MKKRKITAQRVKLRRRRSLDRPGQWILVDEHARVWALGLPVYAVTFPAMTDAQGRELERLGERVMYARARTKADAIAQSLARLEVERHEAERTMLIAARAAEFAKGDPAQHLVDAVGRDELAVRRVKR